MATRVYTSGITLVVQESADRIAKELAGKETTLTLTSVVNDKVYVQVAHVIAFEPVRETEMETARPASIWSFYGTRKPVNPAAGDPETVWLQGTGSTKEEALRAVERHESERGWRFGKIERVVGPHRTPAEAAAAQAAPGRQTAGATAG